MAARSPRSHAARPAVVKPVDADNSHGVTLVLEREGLRRGAALGLRPRRRGARGDLRRLGREVRCGIVVRDGALVCLPLEEYAVDRVRGAADKLARDRGGDLHLVAKEQTKAWIVDVDDPVTAAVWDAARRWSGTTTRALFERAVSAAAERVSPEPDDARSPASPGRWIDDHRDRSAPLGQPAGGPACAGQGRRQRRAQAHDREPHQLPAVHALQLDPLDAQIRQVFFFDTPDLALNRARRGRARAPRPRQGRRRSSSCGRSCRTSSPPACGDRANFVVEVDAIPGGFVCSGAMKRTARPCGVRRGAQREAGPQLFSKQQRAFYAAHPPEGMELDDLRSSGPSRPEAASSRPAASADGWWPSCGSTPTGRGSSSSPPSALRPRRSRRVAETHAFLTERGIDLTGEQHTKTTRALDFFSTSTPAQ